MEQQWKRLNLKEIMYPNEVRSQAHRACCEIIYLN